MDKEALKLEIKEHLIKYLNLLDFTPETIDDNMPMFGDGGLELDSIDSLELIVMLEREYSIKVTNPQEGRKIFISVQGMADYISETKKNC